MGAPLDNQQVTEERSENVANYSLKKWPGAHGGSASAPAGRAALRGAPSLVSEGHPDKVADGISDGLLDSWLGFDAQARVAVETLVKDNHVIIAGEVTSTATIDADAVVRRVIRDIGYTDPARRFHAAGVTITNLIGEQAPDIARGVGRGLDQGAGFNVWEWQFPK